MVTVCDHYPDVIAPSLPAGLEGKDRQDEREKFVRENVIPRRRTYQAIRELLTESFGFTGELPDKLADLRYAPLKDTDRGYYLAVHGILIADGVRLQGDVTGPDDLIIQAKEDIDPAAGRQTELRISPRFVRSVT